MYYVGYIGILGIAYLSKYPYKWEFFVENKFETVVRWARVSYHSFHWTGRPFQSTHLYNIFISIYIKFHPKLITKYHIRILNIWRPWSMPIAYENYNVSLDALCNIEQLLNYYCITEYMPSKMFIIIELRTWKCRQRIHQRNCIEFDENPKGYAIC